MISLDPQTVGEVLGDARTLAAATDSRDAAASSYTTPRPGSTVSGCASGATAARGCSRSNGSIPPFAAGHWVPQMIEFAGGDDVLGFAGERSEERTWEEVIATNPDIVLVMPCGYDAEIAHREAEMHREQLAEVGAGEVVAVNASAFFSRPGPRIVDGLELLAHIIHPELFPEPPGEVLTVEV